MKLFWFTLLMVTGLFAAGETDTGECFDKAAFDIGSATDQTSGITGPSANARGFDLHNYAHQLAPNGSDGSFQTNHAVTIGGTGPDRPAPTTFSIANPFANALDTGTQATMACLGLDVGNGGCPMVVSVGNDLNGNSIRALEIYVYKDFL